MSVVHNNRSIVTDEVVDRQIETIAVDQFGRVDEISLDYNEYRSELISIYKSSIKDNSIISTYFVSDNFCKHRLVINTSSDMEEQAKMNVFNYNQSFIDSFLIPMVEDYNKNNDVVDYVIELLDDDKANFVLNTSLGDSLVLMRIDIELANTLKDLIANGNVSVLNKMTMNEKGIGNHLAIILLMIAVVMILVGSVIFSIFYYR